MMDSIYLAFIVVSSIIVYSALLVMLPHFFNVRRKWQIYFSWRSISLIAFCGLLTQAAIFANPDPTIDNRILHLLGGGFLALLLCYLAERDEKLPINRSQFIILNFSLAMTLGVANEILEFLLQNYAGLSISTSINDTWLDLISNACGAAMACFLFLNLTNTRK